MLLSGLMGQQVLDTQEFFGLYRSLGLDCLITPGLPVPALKPGQSRFLAFGCMYTFLYNILDMPTIAIPVALAEEQDEQ